MDILFSGITLFGLLVAFSLLGYLTCKLFIDCSDDSKFSKRHGIELVEIGHTKFAVCIKCGKRWELDEVDEKLFVKRESKKYHPSQ